MASRLQGPPSDPHGNVWLHLAKPWWAWVNRAHDSVPGPVRKQLEMLLQRWSTRHVSGDVVKSDLRHLTIVQRISQTHVDTYLTSQQLLATSGHLPNCRSGDAHVCVYIYIHACVCACVLYINIQACTMCLYLIMCTLSIYFSRNMTFASEAMSPRPLFLDASCVCFFGFCIRVQRQCSARRQQTPGPATWRAPPTCLTQNPQEMGPQKFHLLFWTGYFDVFE